MPSQMHCIFASSKYYQEAKANAMDIAQPLGYDFLSKKQQTLIKRQKGTLTRKVLFDKPLIKQLSIRHTLQAKISQYLSVSQPKRKFTYLSAGPQSIITRITPQINQQLSNIFTPTLNISTQSTISFTNCFHSINNENLFTIIDYSLTSFFIFYDGKNYRNLMHVLNIFDKEFLEYDVRAIITVESLQNQQGFKKWQGKVDGLEMDVNNITNREKVDEYIAGLKKKAKQIDPMNQGMHFFIGDCTAPHHNFDILKEQIQNLNYLQYYLYLLCNGVLAQGQNAVIKLRGTMRNKTIDFLFLFKLIFTKISLIKPSFSNYLSSERYMICEGYVNENAQQILPFLRQNFHLLAQYGEQRLLVNSQMIFKEEQLADNVKNFNDSFITRGLKQIVDIYLKNSNLQIYPPKALLVQKLKSFEDSEVFQSILSQIQESIPDEQTIKNDINQTQTGVSSLIKNGHTDNKNQLKEQIQQKQAALDIFDFMKQSKPAKQPEKKPKKPKVDQEQQIIKKMEEKFQEQQRIRQQKKKQKKQQEKKQKKQRQQDPYNTSYFDYAQN